ncbi:MAG: SAM-dependent DNA methyltransferase, partial [Thermodesulfobacteriota bacterium]
SPRTRVVSNDEIRGKGSNLSIPLYVRADNGNGNGNGATETVSLKQAIANWHQSSMALRESMNGLFEVLEQQTDHFRGDTKMAQDQFPDAGKSIGASGGKGPRS